LKDFKVIGGFAVILIVWGLNYIFVKTGLEYSTPVWLSFLRALSGFLGAVMLLITFKTKGSLNLREKIEAFLIGIPGSAIFFAFWIIGEIKVPAGEASVLIYTFPIWTLILSIPILRDRPCTLKVGASLLGFGGVALVAGAGTISWNGNFEAILLLLVSGFSFAVDTVLFKKLFKGEQLLRANVWQLGGASAILLPWALLGEPGQQIIWSYQLVVSVLWIGVLGTSLVYFLWFTLLSRYNAASFTAYTFLVVLVALVASFFIFGEKIDALQLVGVGALVASIYLVNKTMGKKVLVSEKSNEQETRSVTS
jgi:probable blue pigment (indigoidine) exporter